MLALTSGAAFAAEGRASIPAPPPEGHCFVDETGRLSVAVRAEVDELAGTIEAGEYGKLQVLVVGSSDNASQLAHDVFAAWPVGHTEHFDGALLLIVARERQAAIVLGDGFGRIAKAQVGPLITKWIAPSLTEGDLDTATVTGTRAMLDLLVRYHRPLHDDAADAGEAEDDASNPPDLPPPVDTDLWHAFMVPLILTAPLFLLLLAAVLFYRLARRK